MSSSVTADKEQTDRERCTDQDNINPGDAARSLPRCIGSFCAFNPFGRHFKCPCDNQRDRKADDEEENYQAHNPIGDVEKWKNLAGDLHQQPGDDAVRDRNLVNIAPLQFGEKIALAHCFAGADGNLHVELLTQRGEARVAHDKGGRKVLSPAA